MIDLFLELVNYQFGHIRLCDVRLCSPLHANLHQRTVRSISRQCFRQLEILNLIKNW